MNERNMSQVRPDKCMSNVLRISDPLQELITLFFRVEMAYHSQT